MQVFIDESGDCGMKFGQGSSRIFVATAVIFADAGTAQECDAAISELRRALRFSDRTEFHFSKSSDTVRTRFLRTVAPFEFGHVSAVIEKTRLVNDAEFRNKQAFYKSIARRTLELVHGHLVDAMIIVDKCAEKEFGSELKRHVKEVLNRDAPRAIKDLRMEKSHTNNLLQLADMVCGAVARSLKDGGSGEFREIVGHRETAVDIWP